MSTGGASAKQVERLVIQVENMESLRKLRDEIELDRLELIHLKEELDAFHITTADFDSATQIAGQRMANNTKEATRLQRAIEANAAASRDWRMNLMGLGYTMNDFFSVSGNLQQRLSAIANNMPMLLAGFGGIGLALSGIMPVIGMFISNFDNIKEYFTGFSSDFSKTVDGMKAKLSELEKKKVKVGVDFLEMEALDAKIKAIEGAIKAVDELAKRQTEEGKATAKAFEDAFVDAVDETGKRLSGADIKKSMVAALIPDAAALSEPLRAAREAADKEIKRLEEYRDMQKKRLAGPEGKVYGVFLASSIRGTEAEIEAQRELKRTAEAEVTKKGGLAEQLLGEKMEQAKHGTEAEQKAAVQYLAERAQKIPEVQARIKELPALGSIESSQARAQKEIQAAQQLQESHIKQATLAEEKGNHDIAQQHWEAAEQEGENAKEALAILDAIYNKQKTNLTARSRRLREIEQERIKELVRQADEKPLIAQGEIARKRAKGEHDEYERRQKIAIDQIVESAEFQRQVSLLRRKAETDGLKGKKLVDAVHVGIAKILSDMLTPQGMDVGVAPFERARGLAGGAEKDLRDENAKFDKERRDQADKKATAAEKQRQATLAEAQKALGPEGMAKIRTGMEQANRQKTRRARDSMVDEVNAYLLDALSQAAREGKINAQDIPNLLGTIPNMIQKQMMDIARNAKAAVDLEIAAQRQQALAEHKPFKAPTERQKAAMVQERIAEGMQQPGVPAEPIRQPFEVINPGGPPGPPLGGGMGARSVSPGPVAAAVPEAPNVDRVASIADRGNGIMGQMQGAMSGMLGRLAQIEANQQILAQQAGTLQRAATEHQVSALPFGPSGTA